MSNYLNPGNENFEICAKAHIYVDKTGLIGYTNKVLSTKQKCICVSHPRRFGKTCAAEMLVAYYSRGCDSRALFENLKIAQDPSFEEHLNKYDVFQINIADVINMTTDAETGLKEIRRGLRSDLKKAYPDITYEDEDNIPSMFKTVYEETGTKSVFIIDEWDCPMRERKDDEEGQRLYLHFLRELLKDKKYVALAYMTGILPIKIEDTESSLNMFDEFTMTDCSPMQECFGFTEDEVKALCEKYGRSFDGMRDWYDGYDVGGVTIYNPWSVVNSLTDGEFTSYWTKTESYEELMRCIEDNEYGTHEAVMRLILGETHSVNPDFFANDLVTLECLDDVLTLLVHLGYLTYDQRTRTARIPNREIREEFVSAVGSIGLRNTALLIRESGKLLSYMRNGESDKIASVMDAIYGELSDRTEYDDEAAVKCAFQLSCCLIYGTGYVLAFEQPAGEGVADFVLRPDEGSGLPPVIVETKYDHSAREALDQIYDRHYTDYFKGFKGEIVLVGINCDGETKRHDCLAERYRGA